MGLENELLNESARDFLFDGSNGAGLVNDSHSVASELTGKEPVVVGFGQGVNFL